MQQIKTKWHKIIPLIDADQVWLSSAPSGKSMHWSELKPRPELLRGVVRLMSKLPKFVIDDELMDLVRTEDFQRSILDMQKAGVLRLPYPALTVEFKKPYGTALVMIRDNAFKDRLSWEADVSEDNSAFWSRPFYGIPLRIETDKNGEYLVISPGVVSINVTDNGGDPWLEMVAQGHDILEASPALSKLIKDVYQKDGALIWHALAAAFLVLRTNGVKQEVVECSKINRKRVGSNKEPIPRHTIVSIGKVYRSNSGSASDAYTRRSPRPHWRCGHLKHVHFGVKGEHVRQVYINPRIVALKSLEDTALPASKEYVVKP